MMDPKRRSQIEYSLQRALTDAELVVVEDLEALPPSHLDVVERLYRKDGIAALYYLIAVTNDLDRSIIRNYVHSFDLIEAQRHKRPGLRAQPLYESELGRALNADEIVGASSLSEITRAERQVARVLLAKDVGIARAYLHDLVPLASSQELGVFVEVLMRDNEDRAE